MSRYAATEPAGGGKEIKSDRDSVQTDRSIGTWKLMRNVSLSACMIWKVCIFTGSWATAAQDLQIARWSRRHLRRRPKPPVDPDGSNSQTLMDLTSPDESSEEQLGHVMVMKIPSSTFQRSGQARQFSAFQPSISPGRGHSGTWLLVPPGFSVSAVDPAHAQCIQCALCMERHQRNR